MKPVICALVLLLGTSSFFAQDSEQSQKTRKPMVGFDWLKQFEGEWSTAFNGTMISRSVGKKWIVSETHFQGNLSSMQTIGFDAEKKQFIGTWIDSTSNFLWHYKGSLDDSGKRLTLEADGPDMTDPTKMRRYRDAYEFTSENEIAVVTTMRTDEGEWQVFNKGKMTRKTK